MMHMDSSSSKNNKMSKSSQAERSVIETKAKKTASKETCFYCGQVGHWKRNCKAYLESRKKALLPKK